VTAPPSPFAYPMDLADPDLGGAILKSAQT
jgi:hypothetical protein